MAACTVSRIAQVCRKPGTKTGEIIVTSHSAIWMRLYRTKEGSRGGTDELAGDRVSRVHREGRGEAGQEAEEGDEPVFTKEIQRGVSSGSSSPPVVAVGRGLPSERLEGVVGEEV
jgi:hypothetical protein